MSTAYTGRVHEYHLSKEAAPDRLVEAAKDAFWFLAQADRSAPDEVRELPEVATLRTVLAQQSPEGPDAPSAWRPTGQDVVESTHKVGGRRGRKRDLRWLSYKVQLTETCDEDRPRLIADLEATAPTDNDNVELPEIQARLVNRGMLPAGQHGNPGYMSAENLALSAEMGIDLVGIPQADSSSPEGFRQIGFRIDDVNRRATCPAGELNSETAFS